MIRFIHRLKCADDEIGQRQGLLLAPDGWHLVIRLRMPWTRVVAFDCARLQAAAHPVVWMRVSRVDGRMNAACGVTYWRAATEAAK